MEGETIPEIDFYAVEEAWVKRTNPYQAEPEGDCVDTAKLIFETLF